MILQQLTIQLPWLTSAHEFRNIVRMINLRYLVEDSYRCETRHFLRVAGFGAIFNRANYLNGLRKRLSFCMKIVTYTVGFSAYITLAG